MASFK